MADDVEAVMSKIPEKWRERWCGGEDGSCACNGCVQIGNRAVMVEAITGQKHRGDPERIDERKIPKAVFEKFKVTKAEWQAWLAASLSEPKP